MRVAVIVVLALALATVPLAAATPVAVLELFTSEGCSSCPPAEAVLARLIAEAAARGEDLEVLEWHVGYWNHLGWRDPYSLPAAAERQRRLTAARGERGAFTPEAVVDGRASLVGSYEPGLTEVLDRAWARAPALRPRFEVVTDARAHTARVVMGGPLPQAAELLVAVVEDGLASRVRRGENARRTLRHQRVVRVARSLSAGGLADGSLTLDLPSDLDPARSRVVVVVSDARTLAVLGAGHRLLEPAPVGGGARPAAGGGR